MPPLLPPGASPRRGTRRTFLLVAASLALSGCHPGNQEVKQLRRDCEAGGAAACNGFGLKLLKGEYVLRDPGRAAGLLKQACDGGVGEGCATLGLMYQQGRGVKRDSSRAAELFRHLPRQRQ